MLTTSMWDHLVYGMSVSQDACLLSIGSWVFWVSVFGVLASRVVYHIFRKKSAAVLSFGFFIVCCVISGMNAYTVVQRNSFLSSHEPDAGSLVGVYEVESSPLESCFLSPRELESFFQVSSSTIRLYADGTCEVASFPRASIWQWWILNPDERMDMAPLESDLVSVFTGTWAVQRIDDYYGVVLTCSPDNVYSLLLGRENSNCLIMPLHRSLMEIVLFKKIR